MFWLSDLTNCLFEEELGTVVPWKWINATPTSLYETEEIKMVKDIEFDNSEAGSGINYCTSSIVYSFSKINAFISVLVLRNCLFFIKLDFIKLSFG